MSTPQKNKALTNAALMRLIKDLPRAQKLLVAKELRRDGLRVELDHLLASFRTEELSLDMIDLAVKEERTKAYGRWRASR